MKAKPTASDYEQMAKDVDRALGKSQGEAPSSRAMFGSVTAQRDVLIFTQPVCWKDFFAGREAPTGGDRG